jgi:hypothetical protein
LIEAGLVPGDAVQLRKPLQAMGKFANDPTCKAVAESVNGQLLTALAIQHHYLTQAEEHAHKPFMPPWAKEVCREWRAILNQLEREPDSVSGILDWRMKLPLYHSHARRRGYDWDSLATWSEVTGKIQEALQAPGHRGQPIRIEMLLSQTSPIAKVKPFLASRGLTWDEFRSFFDLRNELFEIDTRFSQLSGNGIFAGMDDAQVLAHHVPSVNNIKQAMTTPPMVGRAHLRGIGIQRLAEGDPHYVCDWTGIVDTKTGQILDLQDPFANNECWQDFPKHDKQNEDLEDPMSRLFQQHGHPLAALRARVTHRLRSYISNP